MAIAIPNHMDQLIAGWDHKTFDADLVLLMEKESNWGRSVLEADPGITLAHAREFSRLKLVEYLKTIDGVKNQDLSDQRMVLHHIAHRATMMSGILHHANAYPENLWLEQIRASLGFVAEEKKMLAFDEQDPVVLYGAPYKKKSELEPPHRQYLQANAADAEIAWHFLGDYAAPKLYLQTTREKLKQAMPFLVEVDETNIERRLLDVRKKILALFEKRVGITPFLRMEALAVLANEWVDGPGNNSMEEFDTMVEEIFYEQEGDEDPMDLDHDSLDRILSLSFGKLIGPGAPPLDDERRAKTMKRRLLLEFLMMREAIAENDEGVTTIARQYQIYHQALGLRFGDMAYLDLSAALLGTDSLEKLREMLH